jgi:acylpyruvate hydrolase
MKLATYAPAGAQSRLSAIGAVVDSGLIDLNYGYARYLRDIEGEFRAYEMADARIPRDMIGFLQGGDRAIDAARRTVQFVSGKNDLLGISGERLTYPHGEVRLMAPISRPGKILAAGKNYAEHAAESGGSAAGSPSFPRGFVKVSSVVIGPGDSVEIAPVTNQLDYEVELAVVIGKAGRYISKEKAYEHIAGYTILNDVSARDIQLSEAKYGNHLIGKNMDTLSPMGPWIVLKDEVPDPMNLTLELKVNGRIRQNSNTGKMIHDIPALIERWSWVTLEPGDIISTGTPAGVALSGKQPYLAPGDVMECIVERLGSLTNPVVAGKR